MNSRLNSSMYISWNIKEMGTRFEKGEISGHVRKLYNDELYNLCSSPTNIRVMKWRRMMWMGHLARTGQMSNT